MNKMCSTVILILVIAYNTYKYIIYEWKYVCSVTDCNFYIKLCTVPQTAICEIAHIFLFIYNIFLYVFYKTVCNVNGQQMRAIYELINI